MLIQKYEQFVEDLAKQVHHLNADTLKVVLSNVAPDLANHKVLGDVTQIAAGNGYTAGGVVASFVSGVQTSGLYKLKLNNAVWNAAGGNIGPFRYAILYNSTPGSPSPDKPLIQVIDFGASITVLDGNPFTVQWDAVNGALQFG